jgi:hypothetical protein
MAVAAYLRMSAPGFLPGWLAELYLMSAAQLINGITQCPVRQSKYRYPETTGSQLPYPGRSERASSAPRSRPAALWL